MPQQPNVKNAPDETPAEDIPLSPEEEEIIQVLLQAWRAPAS
jgi:hypothetical protein